MLEAVGVPCEGQAEPTVPITEDQAYGGRRAKEVAVCVPFGEIAGRAGQRHRSDLVLVVFRRSQFLVHLGNNKQRAKVWDGCPRGGDQ